MQIEISDLLGHGDGSIRKLVGSYPLKMEAALLYLLSMLIFIGNLSTISVDHAQFVSWREPAEGNIKNAVKQVSIVQCI